MPKKGVDQNNEKKRKSLRGKNVLKYTLLQLLLNPTYIPVWSLVKLEAYTNLHVTSVPISASLSRVCGGFISNILQDMKMLQSLKPYFMAYIKLWVTIFSKVLSSNC